MELLSIEQNFLRMPQVKTALNLTAINKAKNNVQNAQKRKYEHTMTMASLVKNAVDFFESEEGKNLFSEEGIQWSKPDLGLKVFGWQKSFFYKLLKAGNLDQRIIDAFKRVCDNQGTDAKQSLAGLLEFSRTVDLDSLELSDDASEEEVDGAISEAISEAEQSASNEERVDTLITLSFKNPEGTNVAFRIDANGDAHTTNASDEIRAVLAIINGKL
jgi:hypothetical protein